ncbi:hypothetical protein D3C87_1519270 [compost metagenome]
MISALLPLQAIKMISRALKIVPTPIVIALRGTFSLPPKARDASRRVKSSNVTTRVPELGADPGSLKPI